MLTNRIDEGGGLLRIAVSHNRPEILALLLEFGFDPDERTRFRDVGPDGVVFTWGMPLWHCTASGKYEMAEMLLSHGADANADVYASGTPVSEAFGQADWKMIALLEQHGGRVDPWVAAQYRQTDRVMKMLADASDKRGLAEKLLGPAACGGSPEIVRLALDHVDWARDDPRWFGLLEQPLRIWHHSRRHWARPDWDRSTYLTCFRMILERCDSNIRGRVSDGFGLTILHSVAGSREHGMGEVWRAKHRLLARPAAVTDRHGRRARTSREPGLSFFLIRHPLGQPTLRQRRRLVRGRENDRVRCPERVRQRLDQNAIHHCEDRRSPANEALAFCAEADVV